MKELRAMMCEVIQETVPGIEEHDRAIARLNVATGIA
jgi:hypothetical protein